MLKLTRRAASGEEIYIYDREGKALCKFQLINIRGNQVSIGFTAPREVDILRGEIMSDEVRKEADRILATPHID